MSANHGNTPAAWTGVVIGLLGFLVGGVGLMAGSMLWFWVGIILLPLSLIVGFAMSKLGYGAH